MKRETVAPDLGLPPRKLYRLLSQLPESSRLALCQRLGLRWRFDDVMPSRVDVLAWRAGFGSMNFPFNSPLGSRAYQAFLFSHLQRKFGHGTAR